MKSEGRLKWRNLFYIHSIKLFLRVKLGWGSRERIERGSCRVLILQDQIQFSILFYFIFILFHLFTVHDKNEDSLFFLCVE